MKPEDVDDVVRNRYAEFGRMAFDCLKECITEGSWECDAETLADFAVKAGLMVYEPYDPVRHHMKGSDCEYEPGDMIYYWGTPDATGGEDDIHRMA